MKRVFDLVVAVTALFILLPFIAVLATMVAVSLGRPVFFVQQRPGLRSKPFRMVKFRTMRDAHDASGRPLPDGERITRLGAFLRRTSLDELPELYNVVRGEMSLVGPRPLLMAYLDRYNATEARRHEVRPGVTGWAQINGRNALSWDKKFALDVWYVDHRSFLLDLRILLLTVLKVARRDGISAAGEATMPEFIGSAALVSDDHDRPGT
ncbi:sugar transferase [Sphingomonas sp. 8AM]|uniref:sugar transferase n=1 Tax=Sphingomonas sp. 8AM TaxID=2653170 RepID=UPI0012F05EE5|nr:sugar transferase [Sphingomonas sp. 8AM]VXD00941.1 Uncharacterized sugar transferase EpsL [Sphingomonas sp. 8AM]